MRFGPRAARSAGGTLGAGVEGVVRSSLVVSGLRSGIHRWIRSRMRRTVNCFGLLGGRGEVRSKPWWLCYTKLLRLCGLSRTKSRRWGSLQLRNGTSRNPSICIMPGLAGNMLDMESKPPAKLVSMGTVSVVSIQKKDSSTVSVYKSSSTSLVSKLLLHDPRLLEPQARKWCQLNGIWHRFYLITNAQFENKSSFESPVSKMGC